MSFTINIFDAIHYGVATVVVLAAIMRDLYLRRRAGETEQKSKG